MLDYITYYCYNLNLYDLSSDEGRFGMKLKLENFAISISSKSGSVRPMLSSSIFEYYSLYSLKSSSSSSS
jgi:hypothetical protein